MAPKIKFKEGEKVLCCHGPLIYEAKCLKSSVTKDRDVQYLIHYAGWNKKWDEWVPESRVLTYNRANVQRQKEAQKAYLAQPKPVKRKKSTSRGRNSRSSTSSTSSTQALEETRASTPTDKDAETTLTAAKATKTQSEDKETPPDSGSEQPKIKRRRHERSIVSKEQYLAKAEVKIKIPKELNGWLVEDWIVIKRHKMLAILPAKLTVEQILDNYIAFKKSSKFFTAEKKSVLVQIIKGIKDYFNAILGSELLFDFEKRQYSEILHDYPNTPVAQIYGSIHLLRLFTKMGQMLEYTALNEKSKQYVLTQIQDFLKYMVTNRVTFFSLQDYAKATPEYYR